MELKTTDLADPALLIEREWFWAIEEWRKRRPELLVELLRNADGPIPKGVWEFLADLAAGKVRRYVGRPNERRESDEISIVAEVFREWETAEGAPRKKWEESPKAAACALVATRHGITEDAVRGIVERLRKSGLTRDRWESWGRPDWPSTKPA